MYTHTQDIISVYVREVLPSGYRLRLITASEANFNVVLTITRRTRCIQLACYCRSYTCCPRLYYNCTLERVRSNASVTHSARSWANTGRRRSIIAQLSLSTQGLHCRLDNRNLVHFHEANQIFVRRCKSHVAATDDVVPFTSD